MTGPTWVTTEAARAEGWHTQQIVAGLPGGEELTAVAEQSEQGGNAAALQLLSKHGRPWALHGRRPTALFVASDVQAIGAIYACFELGLRVPEDVAIVAIGGTKLAAFTIPPLTTLRQDVEYLAILTVEHLVRRITDATAPVVHHRVRGNLVVGHSCGCPARRRATPGP
jgi:LacI family transcriptional regulator